MKQFFYTLISIMYAMSIDAQNSITGEYYLHGVMETASGFQLNADSTFQFFFSYGALDRSGKGKWSLRDDSTIIFNSEKRPPLDFKLAKHEQRKDDFITIQITDNNSNLLRYVSGFVKTKTGGQEFETNSDGIAQIKIQPIDSVALIFTICPDRYSVFPVTDKNDNYFSFQFEPWIADVFFENFILNFKNSSLSGKHPLLDGNNFSYEKN